MQDVKSAIYGKVEKSKIISIITVIMPILNMYGLPGGKGSFADIALIIMIMDVLIRLCSNKGKLKLSFPLFIFIGFLAIEFLITSLYNNVPTAKQITYSFRYILYFLLFAVGFVNYLDIKFMYKVYGLVSIFSTIWLILQYISMIFLGKYLPGFLKIFPVRADLLEEANYLSYVQFYRPRSIFEEPAHYATFAIGFLLLLILVEKVNQKLILKLFLTVGVALSGSTTGIAMLVLIWCYYLTELIKKKTISLKITLLIIGLIFAAALVLQSSTVQIFIRRTLTGNDAASGRFGNVVMALNTNSTYEFLFGIGSYIPLLTETIGWLPGWILIYKCYGIIGSILLLGVFSLILMNGNTQIRIFFAMFLILNVGTELITSSLMFPYMAYILKGIDLNNYALDYYRFCCRKIHAVK